MNQLIEKANEGNITLNILSIDFYKAFDTVINLQFLWKALTRQGLDPKYEKVIKDMYTDVKAKIKKWIRKDPNFLFKGGGSESK